MSLLDLATPILLLRSVTRVYGDDQSGSAPGVRQIDLSIDEGGSLAITGPSGSGKSTLLNIIGLLDRPTEGSVEFLGEETTALSEREVAHHRRDSFGYIFQQPRLPPHRDILDSVRSSLRFSRIPPNKREAAAREALLAVGLGNRLHHKATELSGGEQQRVGIARAIVRSPRLVLADEPTGNLDAGATVAIVELLGSLSSIFGTTLVVVTHDMSVADAMSRRFVLASTETRLCDPAI